MTTPSSLVSASRPGIFIEAVTLAAQSDRHDRFHRAHRAHRRDAAPAEIGSEIRHRSGRATGRTAPIGAAFGAVAVVVCAVLIGV